MSCIEGKEDGEEFTIVHKIPRYLLIYYKISFVIGILLRKQILWRYIQNRKSMFLYDKLFITFKSFYQEDKIVEEPAVGDYSSRMIINNTKHFCTKYAVKTNDKG